MNIAVAWQLVVNRLRICSQRDTSKKKQNKNGLFIIFPECVRGEGRSRGSRWNLKRFFVFGPVSHFEDVVCCQRQSGSTWQLKSASSRQTSKSTTMLLKEPLLIFSTAAATRTSPFFGVCRPFHSLTPSADGNSKLGHFIPPPRPPLLMRPCQRATTRIWCSTALRTRYTVFTHGFNAVRPADLS